MHMENPDEPIPESDPNDRTPTAGLLSRKVRVFETLIKQISRKIETCYCRIRNREHYIIVDTRSLSVALSRANKRDLYIPYSRDYSI